MGGSAVVVDPVDHNVKWRACPLIGEQAAGSEFVRFEKHWVKVNVVLYAAKAFKGRT